MRLACSTASFPQDRWQIALAKVAWAEFRAVELALREEPFPPEDGLRKTLRANELELLAVDAGVIHLGDDRIESLARVGRAAALARALDCGLVVLCAPRLGTLAELGEALGMLDRALGGLEVSFALRHCPETLLPDLAAAQSFLSGDVPERIGLALDPAAAVMAGWEPFQLAEMPVQPIHVYLNDVSRTNGHRRRVPAGDGYLELEALIEALEEEDYAGGLTADLHGADAWAVDLAAREVRNYAGLLGL